MRVGIDLSPLAYGNRTRGIGAYAENLVAALAASDTTNEYVLFTATGNEAYTLPFTRTQNITPIHLSVPPLGRVTPLLSHQLILPLRARALRLDVLHLMAVPFNPSTPAVPAWTRVPTVITLFDVMPLRLGDVLLKHARHRRFYNFQLNLCRRAAMLITASEATARDLAQFAIASRKKIAVIPLAPPPLDSPNNLSDAGRTILQAAPFLLHVGGDEPQKDQITVLRAFGMLCRNPAFRHHLVLVGKHHLDDTPALEMSTRAARRILRLTTATRADLDALYAQCDAFVFPSLYEGFGLPVLEAMRAGAPVITTNVSALPEIAGDAALFVAPKNPEALAVAIRRVLDDERVRVKLSEAGEHRAQQFTWARAAELTRAVYERVARGQPKPLQASDTPNDG
jgi:glycosyltransferase involved in cell wall biosynthesis